MIKTIRPQFVVWAVLVGVLSYLTLSPEYWIQSKGASAVLFYSVALLLPFYGTVIAAITLLAVTFALTKGQLPPDTIRIVLFALAIALNQHQRELFSPVALTNLLWVAAVPIRYSIYTKTGAGAEIGWTSLLTAGVEIVGVTALCFLRNLRSQPDTLLKKAELPRLRQFIAPVTALPQALFMIAISSALLVIPQPASAKTTVLIEVALLTAAAISLVFSSVLARRLASVINGSIAGLVSAVRKEGGTAVGFGDGPPIAEFAQAAEGIRQHRLDLAQNRRMVNELASEVSKKDEQSSLLQDEVEVLRATAESLSLGVMVTKQDGTVMAINQPFCRMIGIAPTDLAVGSSAIKLSNHPLFWAREVASLLSFGASRSEKLLKNPEKRFSSSIGGRSLEMSVSAQNVKLHKKLQFGDRMSQLLFVTTLAEKTDRRRLQLRLLEESRLFYVGVVFEELQNKLSQTLQGMVEQVAAFQAKTTGTPAYEELAPFAKKTTDLGMHGLRELDRLREELSVTEDESEVLDLSSWLATLGAYVCELDGTRCQVKIVSEHGLPELPSERERKSASPTPEGVEIVCPVTESSTLLFALGSLIRSLMLQQPADLDINLDYELVEAKEKDRLGNRNCRCFGRMAVECKARLLGNITSALQVLEKGEPAATNPEIALFLVKNEIKRSGGFVSLSGNDAQGTKIQIYLPAEMPEQRRVKRRRSEEHQPL